MYLPMTFRLVSSMALCAALAATGCGDDTATPDGGGGGGVMGDGQGVRLSATFTSACARKRDGAVVCWGRNNGEQLGDSTTTDRATPTAVPNVGPSRDVSMGGFHACAVLQNNTVKCWGTNRNGQLGFGMEMTQPMGAVDVSGIMDGLEIASGNAHSCVLRRSGQASCWGGNDQGQVGDGSAAGNRAFPSTVTGMTVITDLIALDAGNNHTCALRDNGGVVCWGAGTLGQLGQGQNMGAIQSVPVMGLADAVHVSAGGNHSCAVRQSGVVVCWGSNTAGQLGDGSTTNRNVPTAVMGITDGARVSCGNQHTCIARRTGAVVCFGANTTGQLGDGSTTDRPAPTPVMGVNNVVGVAAGGDFTCALRGDGSVACWGGNGNGQLGRGDFGAGAQPAAPVTL